VQGYGNAGYYAAYLAKSLFGCKIVAVSLTSRKYNINMRQAAYVIAVERVVGAMKLRGWV